MAVEAYVVFAEGGVQPAFKAEDALTMPVRLPGGVDYAAGTVLGMRTAVTQQNEVQTITITGTPTGGTFTLTFAGATTGPIAYNASAATVQTALRALSTIGGTNVACGGGALPGTAVTVTFQSAFANADVPLLTAVGSFTGGSSPAIAVAETTKGNPGAPYFAAYDDAASDGSQTARCILKHRTTTAPDGSVKDDQGGVGKLTATAYFVGYFETDDLTGLDANGVADLGRLLTGTTSTLSSAGTILYVR